MRIYRCYGCKEIIETCLVISRCNTCRCKVRDITPKQKRSWIFCEEEDCRLREEREVKLSLINPTTEFEEENAE